MNTQKGFINILAVIIGLLVIGGGAYMYINNDSKNINTQPEEDVSIGMPAPGADPNDVDEMVVEDNSVVCTADAMQCPDGSYVGRSGPNCEFVCPEVELNKKYESSEYGISFDYNNDYEVELGGDSFGGYLSINKGNGSIRINDKSAPCGPTGLGTDAVRIENESFLINGNEYKATGFTYSRYEGFLYVFGVGPNDLCVSVKSESDLLDDTEILYTWEEVLRDMKKIISTIKFI